jgi:hypothetical protein
MTTKQAILEIVDGMNDVEARLLLMYLRDEEPDAYPPAFLERLDRARIEIENGNVVSLEELEAEIFAGLST